MSSLVPRPFKRRRRKGLVHTACACAGVSIANGHITIVIVRGFCMMYSSMDDKRRLYDSIRLPHIFLGSPGACACNVYQALSPPPLEGPGSEARKYHACGDMWGWGGGMGRGACWEGASPDPSSNLHYMLKLIQCTIYLYN